jgi:hypothetical protein
MSKGMNHDRPRFRKGHETKELKEAREARSGSSERIKMQGAWRTFFKTTGRGWYQNEDLNKKQKPEW